MAYEKVVAVFDTSDHAQTAMRALKSAGFAPEDISIVNNDTLDDRGARVASESGFWHRLFGSDVDLHEAKVYGHTVPSGGSVLTLRAPDTQVQKAVDILHSHNPVDVNQRAASLGVLTAPGATVAGATTAATAARAVASTPGTVRDRDKDGEVIRLAEEQLNVGKRQVQAGMTRVRRFVTERPVEAQVTLHEEHASVVRRAITDPSYIRDIDWTDRTIEVSETAEQAVVNKSARVVEEVVIGKEGSDRVETVKDKVRRQQVEVERQTTDPNRKTA
jgi:uncharacterized protein (TIGR02271 family)